MAGYIETKQVIIIENKLIIKIEKGSISEGILLKKYISSGNKLTLNKLLISNLILSIFNENITPIIIPAMVDNVPIKKPTIKNI